MNTIKDKTSIAGETREKDSTTSRNSTPRRASQPSAALARLLPAIDGALEAKNGQLSIMLVERILHGQADGRLDDFLKIVQASDLSALATTFNQELLDFIRRLLA